MGQGRKKTLRSENSRFRRRSITQEVENSDVSSISHYLGAAMYSRNYRGSPSFRGSRHRDPTPFPRSGQGAFSSFSLGQPANYTKTRVFNASPTNVCAAEESLPFVSTSMKDEQIQSLRHTQNYQIAELLVRSLFPKNYIMQNEKRRDITCDIREALHTGMQDILAEIHNPFSLMEAVSCPEGPVPFVLGEQGEHIVMFLVNRCRFEKVYGVSVNAAILSQLLYFLPHLIPSSERALYSILVDFVEEERKYGDSCDDELYVKDTEYGHVHRLVELWSSLVNSLYEKYCSYLFQHQDEIASGDEVTMYSPRTLRRSGYLLLRSSGVVLKYRPMIVNGLMKLLYMDQKSVHELLHMVYSKWPTTSPKKIASWICLVQDLFENCSLFMNEQYEQDVNRVLLRILQVVNERHADCGLRALTLLGSDRILLNYIMEHPQRVQLIEKCLQSIREMLVDDIIGREPLV